MKIHIIAIFTDSFKSYFTSSIMWRAIDKWLFEIEYYKLNDFSTKKFKQVDNKAYGMHWQVLEPKPLSKAINHIYKKVWRNIPVVYMSPSGELLNQKSVEKYKKELWKDFIILCGHYEWIDQRIIDKYVTHEVSIWEYIISSWELASMVFIDSLVRNIEGVLWNIKSLEEESFSKKLLGKKEYSIYTRPKEFEWMKVPDILAWWNHGEIEKWKLNNLK